MSKVRDFVKDQRSILSEAIIQLCDEFAKETGFRVGSISVDWVEETPIATELSILNEKDYGKDSEDPEVPRP